MTTSIIILLSAAVVMLIALVAVLVWSHMKKNDELRRKNDVIVREVRRNQDLLRHMLFTVCMCLFPLSIEAAHYYSDIMMVGGDRKCYQNYSGWKYDEQDLNEGADGKYVYLLFKHTTDNSPGQCITGFWIRHEFDKYSEVPESFIDDYNRRWYLAPYDGDAEFKATKGDMNSGTGGAKLFLYYTKDTFEDQRVIKDFWFDDDKNGALNGVNLNWYADDDDPIYMHVSYIYKEEGLFGDASSAFSWYPSGRGGMHFKMLTSTYERYRTFHEATFYLKDEKGDSIPMFWIDEKSSSTDKDFVKTYFKNLQADESTLFLTNSKEYSPKYCLITGNDDQLLEYYREDGKGKASGNGYAEMDWYYPAKIAGKSYMMYVSGSLYHNESGEKWYTPYSKEIGSITFDDLTLETFDAVPGTDSGEEGMVKIPCVSDHSIEWLAVTYLDENGKRKEMPTIKIDNGAYAGFVMLPATEPHDSVMVTGYIVTATWDKNKLGEANWPTSNKNKVTVLIDSVPMLHDPQMLTAQVDSLGSIVLQWKVNHPKYFDILDTDQFLIERSLTGKQEDFSSIGVVMYESGLEDYTFKDSLLISSLKSELLDNAGVPLVRYRVSRATAQQLWGENLNPAVSYVQPQMTTLSLLKPTQGTADWSNRDEQKILVKWDYQKSDASHTYVWDTRAEMRMEIEMANRVGKVVGTTTQVLTAEQISERQLEVTLHQSCVYYKISLVTESKTSPIGLFEYTSATGGTTATVQVPESAFYYENNGKLIKSSLSVRQLQCSALLEWATDGGAIDYFIVKRRDQGKGADAWETIATQLTDNQYEDKTTAPHHKYDYCVLAANDCYGISYQTTDTITGHCANTGTVAGYVRFPDGSGIAGVTVNISSTDESIQVTAKTDETGYFRKDSLAYYGESLSGEYRVAPNLNGFSDIRNITFGTEPGSNLISNVEFYVENNVKFSGFVLYSGTSIPVNGVSFYVDGREVRTATGPVTTDFEGKFTFRMLPGDHTVQVRKKGHIFYQKGYYFEGNDTTSIIHNYTVDKAGVYFYDDTRVKLIGRVAGGKDQEAIPLDNSLGQNNLGDDLQMVFTLEGDRASRLVWDIQDNSLKERDEVFTHPTHDDNVYQTQVHTTQYRKVVKPDVRTGEYEVMLPPVKWKIEQITAKGYATLFQDGHTSDVIDLTDSLTLHTDIIQGQWRSKSGKDLTEVQVKYHAKYNHIYHAPVNISYKQITFDTFDYLGNRYYTAKNLDGTSAKVELVRPVRKDGWPVGQRDSMRADYTFGYPVFNIERTYPLRISATERYYYNNDEKSDITDIVKLSGGKLTIRNGFVSGTHREVVELDSMGEYVYLLEAKQIPYMMTGEQALRTMTMTLEMDGTHYEAEPLRAYILNIYAQPGAKDMMSVGQPVLVDVLRDPPGAFSSAKISKGSSFTSSFKLGMKMARGLSLDIGIGGSWNTWQGTGLGIYSSADKTFNLDLDLVWNDNSETAFNYTMTANSDISTSNDRYAVGADGDVYIGMTLNAVMKPAIAVSAIPDSVYQTMQGAKTAGRLLVIAEGKDSQTGDPLYLVRKETLAVGQRVESTFAHSQWYIMTQILPKLEQQAATLMFTGSREEAQRQANATGKAVYLSLREPDDPSFGIMNMSEVVEKGEKEWTGVFNDTCFTAKDGINYVIIKPASNPNWYTDEVADCYETMLYWAYMIAQNEKEKVNASNVMKNFDVDGNVGMSYSEQFDTQLSASETSVNIATNFTYGDTYAAVMGGIYTIGYKTLAAQLIQAGLNKFAKFLTDKKSHRKPNADGQEPEGNNAEIEMTGLKFSFSAVPAFSADFTPTYGSTEKYTRKESFNISMDTRSHLNFDVLYAENSTSITGKKEWNDVFFNDMYNSYSEATLSAIYNELSNMNNRAASSRGFIYRTRGGATLRTWEPERTTIFYNPGTVLDERTKKIENPIIKMDKQSISGVPYSEPARFKLYLTNESEQPEAPYGYFDLRLIDTSNPHGAKVMMDGMPLTGTARAVQAKPGIVTEKIIEVYAGEGFDYENLTLRLVSQGDIDTYQDASFSVHYLQTAGNVSISTPGDKWIMNTDAPYDKDRGWYMPIIISGFDRNQKNFDHIEFQYKESTRGDEYWTNLCAFYADSLYYNKASGTKEMMPENGNITTRFYGEGVVMEKGYDLRAVLFCRNGNGYLTNTSKVLSGVKDTRRPQLFGTPEPKDGILGAEDDIIFNFSEAIEHNYLQATTNFEVKGETNETVIEENSSLLFDGGGSAESDARRNFASRNVTVEVMIKPDDTGKAMPIFSHGRDGKQLQLWLTENKTLRAVVDDKVVEGKTALNFDGFKRVAMVLNNDLHTLSLYADSLEAKMDSVDYTGVGPIIYGATNQVDVSKRSFYSGRMLQGRVWNRAMDMVLLNMYGNKLLTGYEMGLIDYYPMNEGMGDYAKDGAQGAHLRLDNVGWTVPRSMSLQLDYNRVQPDGMKGLQLKEDFFSRDPDQDYTLMFWFKTDADGRGALLSNGSGRATDVEAADRFFIGFEADSLKYRANGQEYYLGNEYSDDKWHHFALTMNKAGQVANIYLDFKPKASFSTEKIGGMGGNHFYLGNMVWNEQGPDNDKRHQQNALSGRIDGLTLFDQVLPPVLVERYGSKGLNGEEKGLKTYMDFGRQERQKNGELLLVPYVLNKVVHRDNDGNISERNDTVFVQHADSILAYVDHNNGAPIQAYEELRELNFSFVGSAHKLMVNVDEMNSRINKRRIYVTVSDIPDVNGNTMASPATLALFVDRNPLRWNRRQLTLEELQAGEEHHFSMDIINNSGANHTYTIENLPKWLTVDTQTDQIGPKEESELKFTVSKDVNVGTYDNIIYLTDENGLYEPLTLNITIEGEKPDWEVADDMKQYSMNIVARVKIKDEIVTDSRDIVGVFDNTGRCMGVGNVNYDATSAESLVYLNVYDSTMTKSPLEFRLWHYETGKTMMLTPSETITFSPNTMAGTTKAPIVLTAGDKYIQHIGLVKGWNWIAFNVYSNDFRNGKEMLKRWNWTDGDMIVDDNNNLVLRYEAGQWICNKSQEGLDNFSLSVSRSYRVKSNKEMIMDVPGSILRQPIYRQMTVKQGWNNIGYTPMINLHISTALSDYLDEAEDGDVIKSRTEFAMFTVGANGSKEWKGSLQYMKPGEGYMLYRKKQEATTFTYAFYEPESIFFEDMNTFKSSSEAGYARTMSMTAQIEGVELEEGDRLLVVNGAEIVGEASAETENPVYLSIAGDSQTPLSFVIERNGDMIATAHNVIDYKTDAIVGSPDKPMVINFAKMDILPREGWYTLQGIKLQGKPKKSGVYIYNGTKQVVK